MSTGLKRVWGAGDNWRVLGYLYYRNSLEYRQLIALNPSFDIRSIPAPGVEINASGEMHTGQPEPGLAGPGGQMMAVDTTINLRDLGGNSPPAPTSQQVNIFPWNSLGEYTNRLGQYTAAALFESDRINGMTLDSPQARTTPVGAVDPARAELASAINRAVLGVPTNVGLTFEAVADSSSSPTTVPVASAGTTLTVNNVTYTPVNTTPSYTPSPSPAPSGGGGSGGGGGYTPSAPAPAPAPSGGGGYSGGGGSTPSPAPSGGGGGGGGYGY